MQYIFRRLGFYVVAAFVSITINFILPRLLPGDPASVIFARFPGQVRAEEIQAMKEAFGLSDGPILQQYFVYLLHVVQGDFGLSISAFPATVNTVIGQGLIWTLLLGSVSLAISFVLGNLLGIIGSWRRGGIIDTVFPPLLTFFGSFPYFWLAMLGLFVLGFQLKLFPLRHAYDAQLTPEFNITFISSVVSHLILPVLSVVLVTMGSWLLRMRNVMVGVLSEEFITLAEAKALPERRVMWNYAARNALLPNITALGISIGAILGGQLLTEVVFSYPGLGFLFLRSVTSLDYPLMQGLFLMITFGVLIANLMVDLTYARLDPRVRTQ